LNTGGTIVYWLSGRGKSELSDWRSCIANVAKVVVSLRVSSSLINEKEFVSNLAPNDAKN
jgi:hypothetical protein